MVVPSNPTLESIQLLATNSEPTRAPGIEPIFGKGGISGPPESEPPPPQATREEDTKKHVNIFAIFIVQNEVDKLARYFPCMGCGAPGNLKRDLIMMTEIVQLGINPKVIAKRLSIKVLLN